MDERCLPLLRKLVSELQGAPYPNTLDGELYLIWYEHVQEVAQNALEYIDNVDPGDRAERSGDDAVLP